MDDSYSFQTAPHAVPGGRKKRSKKMYRSYGMEEENTMPANIMFDRRVVRGNTYAAQVVAANAQAEAERLQAEQRREVPRRMTR